MKIEDSADRSVGVKGPKEVVWSTGPRRPGLQSVARQSQDERLPDATIPRFLKRYRPERNPSEGLLRLHLWVTVGVAIITYE